MNTIADARRKRLGLLISIVESCQEMGDRLDVDTIQEVIDELDQEMGAAAERMPATVGDLSPEAYTAAILLLVVSAALADATEFAGSVIPPGRLRRSLAEIVEQLRRIVALEFIARARPELRTALLTEAAAWGYTLHSPEERRRLLHLLEVMSHGGRVRAADRDAAATMLAKMARMQVAEEGDSA